ncbi:MAG: alanine racemase [bacterium]|nr:alanine racemase [bacterium]
MKTHIEISRDNLIHNLNLFKTLSNKKLMFVVKANAYGHGLKEIISITRELSIIDYYAVDSVAEALTVKQLDDKKKIILLGWADEDELGTLILNGIEAVAPSPDFLKKADALAAKLGVNARLHLKVETGTARLGMVPAAVIDIFDNDPYKNVDIVGIYSHFANIEDTTDHSYAQRQLGIFNGLLAKIDTGNLLKHFSCSASALLFPKTYFDIVRVGISAYGYWPSKQTYISYIEQNRNGRQAGKIELKPVLSWHARCAQVKTLETGDPIGYGLTYRTFNRTRMMVVPVGYYDGYDRKLSNMATVIVKGVKAPVRGRVCMDMFMAEVTHINDIEAGDRVTLLGRVGDEVIDADDLAEVAGSINYEILARINPLIPRIVV